MTDPLTEESIRTAFADLRAQELPHVASPGVAAARRSVSHHRHSATAVAAGLVGLVLLGGGYAAHQVRAEPARSGADLGVAPADSPRPATGHLQSVEPDDPHSLQYPLDFDDLHPNLDPELAGRVDLARIVHNAVFGQEYPPFPSGSFGFAAADEMGVTGGMAIHPGIWQIRVGCGAPQGSVTITGWYTEGRIAPPDIPEDMSAAGERAYTVTARCGETAEEVTAGVGEIALDVTEPDRWLYFERELDGPAQAAGGAVLATLERPIKLRP
jgi:hypothetical protein